MCDDPDGIFARATNAGAQVVRELVDEGYGSRGFTVRDPEGNLWSSVPTEEVGMAERSEKSPRFL